MAETKPNIIIIMTDQQRADCVTGHPVLKTPNLERLASGGILFEQAYTMSPLCMPARASFVSGVYPHNHNIWYNAGRLPESDETYLHHLKKGGYYTAHIGKSHYYNHRGDLRDYEPYMHARGLDYVHETTGPRNLVHCGSYLSEALDKKGLLSLYRDDYEKRYAEGDLAVWPSPLPEEEFPDAYVGAKAVEYIDGYRRDEPLCLFVGFAGPHEPWDAPGKFASMYAPEDIPSFLPPERSREDSPSWIREYQNSGGYTEEVTDDAFRRVVANYYGKTSLIDHWTGLIMDALANNSRLENTAVIFCSDHGEMAGDHRKLHKRTFYESSVLSPLVVSWPGRIKPGLRSRSLVDLLDVFPTILELGGCPPSQRAFGKSLCTLFDDPERRTHDEIYSEVAWELEGGRFTRTTMVLTDDYKYAVDDLGRSLVLFDRKEDPKEQHNLAGTGQREDVEKAMRERIVQFLLKTQYEQHVEGARKK